MISVPFFFLLSLLMIAEIHGSKLADLDDKNLDFEDGSHLSEEEGLSKRADDEEFYCDFETDLCGMRPALGAPVSWKRGKVANLKTVKRNGESYLYASGENDIGTASIFLPKYYGDENGKACVTLTTKEIRPVGVKKSTVIKVGKNKVVSSNLGWNIYSGEVIDANKQKIRISVKVQDKGHVVAVDNIKVGKCKSKREVD